METEGERGVDVDVKMTGDKEAFLTVLFRFSLCLGAVNRLKPTRVQYDSAQKCIEQ